MSHRFIICDWCHIKTDSWVRSAGDKVCWSHFESKMTDYRARRGEEKTETQMDRIWVSFFNAVFTLQRKCIFTQKSLLYGEQNKELKAKVKRVVGQVHNIAIYISQQPFYKAQFSTILELLSVLDL